ncbi:dephospho-CoA kinase [Allorhizobium borbori]|uniref:Dephospho-CoA kinase n=1 Tax=Allorhizobium borbori TaxID=485907 RepID=A0A7W6K2R5_9HYPH|nr:dephospho-CoA kinase [Allorhizobium borbori]MBB4104099.1 dephospho-CoA kinase [Allorhizobium borbori]
MIILGLTGSIGMGKSTTADFFRAEGVPVNDSDAVVHDLYRSEAVEPVGRLFPGSVENGTVNRVELSRQLSENPAKFKELEAVIHPLVRAREGAFLERERAAATPIVLLDIPLLFETGGEARVDAIVVVTCDPEIQRARVLARPGMTVEKFELILSRQISDAEKRKRADFIIDTGQGLEAAHEQVRQVLAILKTGWKRKG